MDVPGGTIDDGCSLNFNVPSVHPVNDDDDDDDYDEDAKRLNDELKKEVQRDLNDFDDRDDSYQDSTIFSKHNGNNDYIEEVSGNKDSNDILSYSEGDIHNAEPPSENKHVWSDNEDTNKSQNTVSGITDSINSAFNDHSVNFDLNGDANDSSPRIPLKLDHLISDDSPPPSVVALPITDKEPGIYPHSSGNQTEYMMMETDYEQLKILYETRGKEIDKLSDKLSQQKDRIFSLREELRSVRSDKEGQIYINEQLKILVVKCENKIRDLNTELYNKEKSVREASEVNRELKRSLESSQSTIRSLEIQVAELQTSDLYKKSQQAHELFVNKLKVLHSEENENFKRQISDHKQLYEEEKNLRELSEEKFQCSLRAKDEMLQENVNRIKYLEMELQTVHEQIHQLPNAGSNTEIEEVKCENSHLREKLSDTESLLSQYRNDLRHIDMLLKMKIFKSILPSEDSLENICLSKRLNFDETPQTSSDSAITKRNDPTHHASPTHKDVKHELLRFVTNNIKQREHVDKLTETVSNMRQQIVSLSSKLKDATARKTECDNSMKCSLIEENVSLKEDNSNLMKHYSVLAVKSDNILSVLLKVHDSVALSAINFEPDLVSALKEAINKYTETIQNFSLARHKTLNELRNENNKLKIKYHDVDTNLADILERLQSLRNDIHIEGAASLHLENMNHLFEVIIHDVQLVKDESLKLNSENVDLRNVVWQLRLNYEKQGCTYSDILIRVQMLSEMKQILRKEVVKFVNYCKANFLASIQKVQYLEMEYQKAMNNHDRSENLTKKLKEVQESYLKLSQEKAEVEDKYNRTVGISYMTDHSKDKYGKQNYETEKTFHDKKIQVEIESKLVHGSSQSVQLVEKGINTDSGDEWENVTILKERIYSLEKAYETLKSNFETIHQNYQAKLQFVESQSVENDDVAKEKCGTLQSGDSHIVLETTETFMKANESNKSRLKINNLYAEAKLKTMKSYYEDQVCELKEKLDHLKQASVENIYKLTEHLKQLEISARQMTVKIAALTERVKHQEEEKLSLISQHEEEIKIITDELQNQESLTKELRIEYETKVNKQTKALDDFRMDRDSMKAEVDALKEEMTKQKNQKELRYLRLKDKYYRLQKNFNKYKTGTDDRLAYYVNEGRRMSQLNKEKKLKLLESFKEWVWKTRCALTESISQVIADLKAIQMQQKVPLLSDLNSVFHTLNLLYESCHKLEVKYFE